MPLRKFNNIYIDIDYLPRDGEEKSSLLSLNWWLTQKMFKTSHDQILTKFDGFLVNISPILIILCKINHLAAFVLVNNSIL